MIKKMFTGFTAGMLFTFLAPAQTLFTYGNKAVSQQEFIKAFEKNPSPGNRQQAMKDYLPLFINYKLKVQDALDKKMDTLPGQRTELENYHSQLVENYIGNKANTSQLVKEAFDRSQEDILLGHLFIGFNAADSLSVKHASDLAQQAKAALDAKQDFAQVVRTYSTDESNKATGGRVGWITVFSVPYPFETIIYNLPAGGYSQVVKSNSGFHIFKKIQERPAAGTVKIAQIMLVNADTANKANDLKNKLLADSIYSMLQKGASFDSLANEYSNDRTSYDIGGVLPEFGVGTYSGLFEDMAFGLKTKGEITKPFATEYGWHILKLLEKKPVGKKIDDADINTLLTQKVNASGRSLAAKNVYLRSQQVSLKFKAAPVSEKELFRFTDSALSANNTKGLTVTNTTSLYSFGSSIVTAADWVQFVKTSRFAPGGESKTYAELLPAFQLASTEKYLEKHIESIEPSLTSQLKEFRDANLLFEAMEKNVWNKASADTAGLKDWYKDHKEKYLWNESAAAAMITCTDSAVVDEVYARFVKDPFAWHQITESYSSSVFADSSRFELSQLPAVNGPLQPGTVTPLVKNEVDGSYSFACIFKILPGKEQRSFEDASGFVINDYQLVLEERWIASLKKKYPVKVNEANWSKLLANAGRAK